MKIGFLPLYIELYDKIGYAARTRLEKFYETLACAFEKCGVDPLFYTSRKRSYEEILPWDHLDYGIRKQFLISESKKAYESQTTPHCRIKCAGCGSNMINGGECDAMRQSMV